MITQSPQTNLLYWFTLFVLVVLIALTALRVVSRYADGLIDANVTPIYAEELL